MRGVAKEHWMDACVGKSTLEQLRTTGVVPLLITANGSDNRHMCLMDKHGFPRTKPKQTQAVKGYETGDIVTAVVTQGKKVGCEHGKRNQRCIIARCPLKESRKRPHVKTCGPCVMSAVKSCVDCSPASPDWPQDHAL